jgi:hypothetical protein
LLEESLYVPSSSINPEYYEAETDDIVLSPPAYGGGTVYYKESTANISGTTEYENAASENVYETVEESNADKEKTASKTEITGNTISEVGGMFSLIPSGLVTPLIAIPILLLLFIAVYKAPKRFVFVRKNRNRIFLIASMLLISMVVVIHITTAGTFSLKPAIIEDSDGNPSPDIVQRIVAEEDFEDVNLKVEPFGFVTVREWDTSAVKEAVIKKAVANVMWKTDGGMGAGNIYVGYSTDGGNTFVESGPFNESEEVQHISIELPSDSLNDLENVQVRLRGEDTDYRLAAKGYVSFGMDVYV